MDYRPAIFGKVRIVAGVLAVMTQAVCTSTTRSSEKLSPSNEQQKTPIQSSSVIAGEETAILATEAKQEAASEPPRTKPIPLEFRKSKRTLNVYTTLSFHELRGQINADASFAIYSYESGQASCEGDGWARVDLDGFVCLEHTVKTEETPMLQPLIDEAKLTPFLYGKPKQTKAGELLQPIPRYRNRYAFIRGEEPIDYLTGNRQYAFAYKAKSESGYLLIDRQKQAVPAQYMNLFSPSRFAGRNLEEDPVPEDYVAAWTARKLTPLRSKPSLVHGKTLQQLKRHTPLAVSPMLEKHERINWVRVFGAESTNDVAYIEADALRRWNEGEALSEVTDDELWIDVDLQQQMLAVMRGSKPIFITLISSGRPKDPTPTGIFRIHNKQGEGKMQSRPNDEESYYVESVPWVQYFHQRFALHGAFWHNSFGRRLSHGCINLAPSDAAYLYHLTKPEVPPGWNKVYESKANRGSLIRIRKGTQPVRDRRKDELVTL